MKTLNLAVVTLAAAAACVGCMDSTQSWQLAHDRILAVRANPPHIPAGGSAALDVLITTEAGGPAVVSPVLAEVPSEASELGMTVVPEDDGWTVVAPAAPVIEAARAALELPPGAPVPVPVTAWVDVAGGEPLAAVKTIYLGTEGENPALGEVTIDGAPAQGGITMPVAADVELRVGARDTDEIDWLTSFAELTDVDDPIATVVADQAGPGHVAVVIRDGEGGVAWGFWAIVAE